MYSGTVVGKLCINKIKTKYNIYIYNKLGLI